MKTTWWQKVSQAGSDVAHAKLGDAWQCRAPPAPGTALTPAAPYTPRCKQCAKAVNKTVYTPRYTFDDWDSYGSKKEGRK